MYGPIAAFQHQRCLNQEHSLITFGEASEEMYSSKGATFSILIQTLLLSQGSAYGSSPPREADRRTRNSRTEFLVPARLLVLADGFYTGLVAGQ